jgi:hypothetical protein
VRPTCPGAQAWTLKHLQSVSQSLLFLVQGGQPTNATHAVLPLHSDCNPRYSQCVPLQWLDHWLDTQMSLPARNLKWHTFTILYVFLNLHFLLFCVCTMASMRHYFSSLLLPDGFSSSQLVYTVFLMLFLHVWSTGWFKSVPFKLHWSNFICRQLSFYYSFAHFYFNFIILILSMIHHVGGIKGIN